MRQVTVTLMTNTNSSVVGSSIDVSGAGMELGVWVREAEKELTKVTPSEQTLKLIDADGSIWTWIESQIQVIGSKTAFYPPWVFIDIDGVREFSGFAYPRKITHDEKTGEIGITAQDWSSGLTSKYLGADDAEDDLDPGANPWLRPYPKAASNRAEITYSCMLMSISRHPTDYDVINWQGPEQFLVTGDFATCDLSTAFPAFPAGKHYKVYASGHVAGANGPEPNWFWAKLEGLGQDIWDHIYQASGWRNWNANFTRVPQSTDFRDYYMVTKNVASDAEDVHVIDLDVVDGLNPGDVLVTKNTTNASSYTVLQVDAETLQVITKEAVTNLTAGTSRLFFSNDSLASLVLDEARLAIKRAVTLNDQISHPYGVDFSRFTPPTVANPVLVWLPLRPMGSADLSTVRDLDQGLGDLRVFGAGSAAWNGTPEAGWTVSGETSLRAPWSSQLAAAPAWIMPDESATFTPSAPKRNVPVWAIIRDVESWDPAELSVPAACLVYDYLMMRRMLIKKDMSVTISSFTGPSGSAAWSSGGVFTWPGTSPVLSASVFPNVPGSLLGLTAEGLRLVLPNGTDSVFCTIPDSAQNSVLCTTPWASYLVGPRGYGKVTYTNGALALAWISLSGLTSIYPNTFQGLNPNEIMVLARFDGVSSGTETVTETHLLCLSATPAADAQASVLSKEKVLDGAPRTLGALRDPVSNRIVGHCGGRLFVFGRTLPASYAIERYTPSGLKAMELIEHVCQILNCVAVPDPLGTLHIISRGLLETPIPLMVDRVSILRTRVWEHFYSVVRVSSANDDAVLSDAWGMPGGDVLEYSQHPLLWTQSGCDAVAESLSQWFGVARAYREEQWFWTDTDHPAPWESLPPIATVQINGEATVWLVLAIQDDKMAGKATAKLLEVK